MAHPARSGKAQRSIGRHLRVALLAGGILLFGFGGWAATTEMSGAVLASGKVVVDANIKRVQHPVGGIVSAIYVRNGQRVALGDTLISLDPTVVAANLAVITKALDALQVRQRRLEAERDQRSVFTLADDLVARLEEPDLAALFATEQGFFNSRREARDGMKAQLGERIIQFGEQVTGLTHMVDAYTDTIELISSELTGAETLFEDQLVSLARVTQLKRDEADMRGRLAQTQAEIAKVRGQIAEVELQIHQVDVEMFEEVNGLLRELQEKSAELVERRTAALDQQARLQIRAPADGVVHELTAHTVGGVVEAGATVMFIVPTDGALTVEVRLEGQDRDQVYVGQNAFLRMTAFDQRTTPELAGVVTTVGADLVQDAQSGMQFYPVRIALLDGEMDKLGSQALEPGMPVDTFVQTSYRSVLTYLTRPITDYLARAFRGD
jgi:HlyD family secretion protein